MYESDCEGLVYMDNENCAVFQLFTVCFSFISVSQVIYQLCACSDTSGPTMRYLRTSQDFLFSHLQHLPFILPGEYSSSLLFLVLICKY